MTKSVGMFLALALLTGVATAQPSFLEAAKVRIGQKWTGSFLRDCDRYLKPDHKLNNKTLVVSVDLTVSAHGKVETATVAKRSTEADFDRSAVEVALASSPLPKPATADLSDDGKLHLRWSFARGPNAGEPTIRKVRWPASRAVPMLIKSKRYLDASERLQDDKTLDLARKLAESVIAEALSRGTEAPVELAGLSRRKAFAGPLLKAATSTDPRVQAQAMLALGRIGAQQTTDLLLKQLKHPDRAVVEAAAKGLGALGEGDRGWAVVAPDLQGSPRATLVLAARLKAPTAATAVATFLKTGTTTERVVAAKALGACANGRVGSATAALRKALTVETPKIRAAAAQALARVGRDGARSKGLFYRVIPLHKDESASARAGAIVAMAALGRERANDDVGVICRRAKTATMRAACAEALALINTEMAARSLTRLAKRSDRLLQVAIESLARRETQEADARLALLGGSITDMTLEQQVLVVAARMRANGHEIPKMLATLNDALAGPPGLRLLYCAAWLRASR